MVLGRTDVLGLSEARERARAILKEVAAGRDPQAARLAQRAREKARQRSVNNLTGLRGEKRRNGPLVELRSERCPLRLIGTLTFDHQGPVPLSYGGAHEPNQRMGKESVLKAHVWPAARPARLRPEPAPLP